MLSNPALAKAPGLPLDTTRRFYLTGKTPRALWQRFRFWRAYRRPVTFLHLRKIAHDSMYKNGNYHNPDPAAEAFFNAVIQIAERPVWARDST